jgi:DNA polymerase/3'-5' exonuclease PolX
MQLTVAQRYADYLTQLLAPALLRCEVAGSIRRGKSEVKDIELVAIPRPRTDAQDGPVVFGEPLSAEPPIARLIAALKRTDTLAADPELKRDGVRYKRVLLKRDESGKRINERVAVDLFLTRPDYFGAILAIRTGDAEFSKALVTPREQGGLLPDGLAHEDGSLYRGDEVLDCPDERAYFGHLQLAVPEPGTRNSWLVGSLRRQVVALA